MNNPDPFSLLEGQYDAYLAVIGEMCVTFSSIEQSVTQLVCICLGGDDWNRGLIIVDDLQYRKTVDLLASLATTITNPDFQARILDLVPQLITAGIDRNQYVHATMMIGLSQNGEFILDRVRHRKGKLHTSRRVSFSDLKAVVMTMNNTRTTSERLVIDWLKLFA